MVNGNLLTVYPNPSNSTMTIHSGSDLNSASIIITGINGELIEQRDKINDNDILLDVSEWTPGIYFFRICNGNGQTCNVDCAGVIGGIAIMDRCGVCKGDGLSCQFDRSGYAGRSRRGR